MNLIVVANESQFAQAMQIRKLVFVDEQKIPERLEFDGNDYGATHILALDNGKSIGTMRIRYFNRFVKFERMCVLPQYRKSDVAEQIMRKGMDFAAEKGYEKVYGICKKELLSRWQSDGFEPIPGVAPVQQNGMTLIPITCALPRHKNAINMQTPAEILNAREDSWESARAAYENSETSQSLKRLESLLASVRYLKKGTDTSFMAAKVPFRHTDLSR